MALGWSNKYLREVLVKKHGNEILDLIDTPMNSIQLKFNIAVFHARKCQEVVYEVLPIEPDKQVIALFEAFFSNKSDKSKSIEKAKLAAEAHLIAYIQIMHSIHDSLGQVIYYSLIKHEGNSYKLKEKDISLRNVHEKLKLLIGVKPEYSKLEKYIRNFFLSKSFQYLDALNNNIKHHGLVNFVNHVSCDDWSDGVYYIKIDEFMRKNIVIPSKKANRLVGFERDILFKRILIIGIALNQVVSSTT